MSPKLPAVTGKDVARVAERLGFELRRQRGSHAVEVRPSDKTRVVIPMHSGTDLKRKALRRIIDDLKITVDEFSKLV